MKATTAQLIAEIARLKRCVNALDRDEILKTATQVAERTGLSRWTVQAVKKASKGMPDCPFSGRYTTQRRFETWLFDHPEFVATRVMRKTDAPGKADVTSPPLPPTNPEPKLRTKSPRCKAKDRPLSNADKSDARFLRRARHIALLAEQERQHAPAP